MKQRLNFIEKEIRKNKQMPHLASAVAYEFFLLLFVFNKKSATVENMLSAFKKRLFDWELEDLLHRQVEYANTLANSKGNLEYEEMHKLFSLCDEIHGLEKLGFLIELLEIVRFSFPVTDYILLS